MGTYLVTGIVQNVYIRKKDIPKNLLKEDLEKSLSNDINLEHYLFQEDDNQVSWKIKPQMLEGNFIEFIENQYNLYDSEHDWQKVLTAIRNANDGQKRLELAADKEFSNFQLIEHIFDFVRISDNFRTAVDLNYHLISLFMDGKIMMECYKNILNYFVKNIRILNREYPIAECLKVMITE
jgi:hypothetical protein